MLNKKLIIPVLSSLVLATAIPAVNTEASVAKKTVVANYNNIKVNYNGSAVSVDPEPFIINGTTYIPLRSMGTLFNKNVTWDGGSYTINVSDKPDSRTAALEAEIASLKSQIAAKDATISDLRADLADKDDDDSDSIDDLESDIQDEYEDYFEDDYDVTLDITVDGDEDDVEIEIEVDSSEGDYDDIDESDWEDLVDDIMESVWDNDDFEEASIEGTIYDTEEDDELYEFLGNYDDEEDEDYYKEFDGDEID